MRSKEYLQEIRKSAGLVRAVLRKIVVERGEAVFYLVTDVNYTPEDLSYAEEVTKRYAEGLKSSVRLMKSIPSEEAVRLAVLEILKRESPSLAAFVEPEDVAVTVFEGGGRFSIVTGEGDLGSRGEGLVDAVAQALMRGYCGVWTGELVYRQTAMGEIVRDIPPEEIVFGPRYFKIADYAAIDGASPAQAIYISDLTKETQDVCICGAITHIEERTTKAGKPYFSLTVSDGTGAMRASYFSKKATVEKVRDLRQGMQVCLTGDYELYNGNLSFRAKTIDRAAPPNGFVPEQRPSRPVPSRYRAVFPVPETDLVQEGFFERDALPEDFKREKFVVFDLETTGLSLGGVMDKIIEVGAVKIENGHITERFSTFVACPVRVPPEIVEITHITDEMLVGAPEIGPVIADFYKFAYGCRLVAHNTQFDCRLIKYYGEAEGYRFDQRQHDTLLIAQNMLKELKNHKLDTVAKYFGFDFEHHRAFEDAFVTAKIFIELVRRLGHLPDC